ncbi:MAG: DUF2283 domain-containing protein [Tepidisphaeraceae bacterium]
MKLTYDPDLNIAYIRLRKKSARVRTITVSDELNVDLGRDGSIYGIEFLNAREQLSADRLNAVVVEDKGTGKTRQIAITV